jgi:hypothetical protein
MGLVDLNDDDDPLSTYSKDTLSVLGMEENNLMSYTRTGYKLRGRGMLPPLDNSRYQICIAHKGDKNKCVEYQWDCLHNNGWDFCIAPYINPYSPLRWEDL